MRCMRRTITLAIALLAMGAVSYGAEKEAVPIAADVMTMVQDARCKQVVVTCLVNNRPMRMLLDTGASHTVLHSESAEKLEGVRRPDTSRMQFSGNARQRPKMLITSLATGPVSVAEHLFMVLDLSAVRGSMAEPVDGILGMDILGALPFTFDQRRGEFYWGVPEKAQAIRLNGYSDRFGRLIVQAECGGKPMELLLDTGSSVTRVLPEMWLPGVAEEAVVAHVGDVNSTARLQLQIGKPGNLTVAPGVELEGVTPLMGTPEQPPILGMDALRSVALVHVPAQDSPFGVFFVVK